MRGSRFAIVCVLLTLLTIGYSQAAAQPRVNQPQAAPLLQATPIAPEATPATSTTPPPGAPVGEGTRQVLTILGLVLGVIVLIGGGIYLRHRWMATRY